MVTRPWDVRTADMRLVDQEIDRRSPETDPVTLDLLAAIDGWIDSRGQQPAEWDDFLPDMWRLWWRLQEGRTNSASGQ